MDTYATPEPRLVSFVLRFVYNEAREDPEVGSEDRHDRQGWYGIVRHVQSNTERHFTRWEDVSAFVATFVDLGKEARDE